MDAPYYYLIQLEVECIMQNLVPLLIQLIELSTQLNNLAVAKNKSVGNENRDEQE